MEELEKKCRMLEDALKYGEITTLSRMIMEYQTMSVSYLEHISREMQIYRYSYEERQQGMDYFKVELRDYNGGGYCRGQP